MRQVVRHEMQLLPSDRPKQFVDRAGHLAEPQPEGLLQSRIPPVGAIPLAALFRIERESDVIDVACGQPGVLQAKADRAFGQLVRVVDIRPACRA